MKKKPNTYNNAIRDSIEDIAAEPASALLRGNKSPLGYVN
jgi:hypothetical protein